MSQLTVEVRAAGAAGEGQMWVQPLVDKLVEDRVASALANQDPTLWGPRAQAEAARRLAWVTLPETSRPLLATVEALRDQLRSEGIDRVVLAGMGGSSLAPEVICATAGVPLTVLDTTDPGQVAAALAGDLARTVLVVSSKSGTTVETDSHRRVFAAAFAAAGPDPASVATSGTLGGQFLLWEHAIAVVGRLLGINPFDQPDVEAAKVAARTQLTGAATPTPAFVDGEVAVHPVGDWLPAGVSTLSDALWALVTATPPQGYLAVQAYLDRVADASAAVLRTELARRSQLQTTFGWGPRFLHSTGQYHKGGHQNGAFLQLTGAVERDIPVPGTGFTLGELQQAQALGDAQVLAAHGRPVLRLHLLDRAAGLVALVHALQEHR